jgi:hypothetical protein
MISEILFTIIVMLSLVVIGNFYIHFYFKKKHELFLLELKEITHETFKNIHLTMEYTSKLSFTTQWTIADVVFTKNNIFILQRQRFFNQYGSVLRFSNDIECFHSDAVRQTFSINDYQITNDKLVLFSNKMFAMKVKIKATIPFPTNTNIQAIIDQYDLNLKS